MIRKRKHVNKADPRSPILKGSASSFEKMENDRNGEDV